MLLRRTVPIAALAAAALLTACGGADEPEAAPEAAGQPSPEVDAGFDGTVVSAAGLGRASGPPDTMVVSLNVHTDGATAAETLDTTSLRTQQLLEVARGQGVADEDLQTSNVSVYPRYDQQGRRVVGYSADNAFTVRYRDLAAAGGQLDELVGVGGDFVQVQGLALEIDDPTSLLDEARTDAVERAATQAQQLAAAAGVELGRVRRITEVPVGSAFGEGDEYATAGRAADQSAVVAVPIAGGGQEVQVQVVVVYDLA